MKTKNRANYLIGLTVIVCCIVLLSAMTFALSGRTFGKAGRKLEIDFQQATGLNLHSLVKYAGKTAGRVAAIRYLKDEERERSANPLNAVRVELELDNDVPPLTESVAARVDAETLLGEKFVALIPGAPGAGPLPAGAVIQGQEASSIEAVARSAQGAVETVHEVLLSFQSDYPTLVPRLAELLTQANALLAQGSNALQSGDKAILNANEGITQLKADLGQVVPQISALLAQAQKFATNADSTLQKVDGLVQRVDAVVQTNEGDLAKTLEELKVVAQNLKVITTYAKALSANLAEKPSSLLWSRKKTELPGEEEILRSTVPITVRPKR